MCKQYFFRTPLTASNFWMPFCKNKDCIIWITHCITHCCNDQHTQKLHFIFLWPYQKVFSNSANSDRYQKFCVIIHFCSFLNVLQFIKCWSVQTEVNIYIVSHFARPYSLRMQRTDSSLSFPGLLLLRRLRRFGFCKNKWKSYQFLLDLLIDCNMFSAILYQIQNWLFYVSLVPKLVF